jgi:hypothetical protein
LPHRSMQSWRGVLHPGRRSVHRLLAGLHVHGHARVPASRRLQQRARLLRDGRGPGRTGAQLHGPVAVLAVRGQLQDQLHDYVPGHRYAARLCPGLRLLERREQSQLLRRTRSARLRERRPRDGGSELPVSPTKKQKGVLGRVRGDAERHLHWRSAQGASFRYRVTIVSGVVLDMRRC